MRVDRLVAAFFSLDKRKLDRDSNREQNSDLKLLNCVFSPCAVLKVHIPNTVTYIQRAPLHRDMTPIIKK